MKIKEIIDVIEKFAPPSLAAEYDNVGLLLGDENEQINKVLTTLDVTLDVAKEAADNSVELIITHHPLIFAPQKSITAKTTIGKTLLFLAKHNIAVYAAHTNADCAKGGINDALAKALGLYNIESLEPHIEGQGIGRIGQADTTMGELCNKIMDEFSLEALRFTGNENDKVGRVALCSGSGSDDELIAYAQEGKADVYITGEIKYHHALECKAQKLNLIELGHYESEHIVAKIFAEVLSKSFDNLEILISKHSNVFNTAIKNDK